MHTSIFLTLLFLATISARRIDNDFQEQFEASNDFIRAKHYGFELPSNLRGEPATECSPEMEDDRSWYYSETTDAWFLATSTYQYDYQTAVSYCSSLSIPNFDGELAAVNTTAENDIMASLMVNQDSASGLNSYYWSGWNFNQMDGFVAVSSVADSSSIYECSAEDSYTIVYNNSPTGMTLPGPNTMVIYDDSARFLAGKSTSQIQSVACQLRCTTTCTN